MIEDPVAASIVGHALEHGTVTMTYVLEQMDKSTAAGLMKQLVADGWLTRNGRAYVATPKAEREARTDIERRDAEEVFAKIAERPDEPDLYKAQRERERLAALMARVEALEAAGVEVDVETRETVRLVRATSDDWRIAVPAMFPSMCTRPFAPHHEELLGWVYSIEQGDTPRPWVSLWGRGGAKSALCEMACIILGHRRVRKYCLFVGGKQSKADDHVASIAALLESPELAAIDPELCERQLNKYGSSKGWRHNRLTTKAGFTVDAVGLDSDVRGARIGADRVDLIIFDDVDGLTDTPATTQKKIDRITKDLIGTQGDEGIAMMFVQNIIHGKSVAASLAGLEDAPKIDFMARRLVSGPIPAIEDLKFEDQYDAEIDRNRIVITDGRATWPEGFGIERCQHVIDTEGLIAFLSECQHVEGGLKGTMFESINFARIRRSFVDLPGLNDDGTWRGPCCTFIDPAVTSTDKSDCCAVVTDGLSEDRKTWRLDSWERISTPEEATLYGLESAMRWGAQVCGFEVDQGGDTWEVVYRTVVKAQLDDSGTFTYQRHIVEGVPIPRYEQRRATQDGSMSKRQRIAQMLARYQTDDFRHYDDGCVALEAGLKRFPQYKPYDVCDAADHSRRWLAQNGGEQTSEFRMRNPAKRGGGMSGPIAVRR